MIDETPGSDMPEAATAKEAEDMKFDLVKTIAGHGVTARLGRLAVPRREPLDTPNFLAVTSRGVLPHLTPDNLARHATFPGVYMALEDCESSVRPCNEKHTNNASPK